MTTTKFTSQKDFEQYVRQHGFMNGTAAAKAAGIAINTIAKWVDESFRNIIK